jgi:uncharacterized membrane protein
MPRRGRRLLSQIALSRAAQWRRRYRAAVFGGALFVGVIVYFAVGPWLDAVSRFVAGYDAAVLTLLWLLWTHGLHGDASLTRARAAEDDPGRNVLTLTVLGAICTGLVAAIAILGHGPHVHTDAERYSAYLLGFVAISAGWFMVHTLYTFRYAHLYWHDDDRGSCGGIRFPGTDDPSDHDFAYFAFTLGTSFAVSDPQVTDTRVRREVIVHAIISFAYNSVIIGMVINLFAGIFSSSPSGGK